MSDQELPPEAEKQAPIAFEEAEQIIENQRPEYLRKLETPETASARREYTFHFTAAKLLDQGENRPLSATHADTGEGLKEMVVKPLSEWRQYFLEAAAERAGVKLKY